MICIIYIIYVYVCVCIYIMDVFIYIYVYLYIVNVSLFFTLLYQKFPFLQLWLIYEVGFIALYYPLFLNRNTNRKPHDYALNVCVVIFKLRLHKVYIDWINLYISGSSFRPENKPVEGAEVKMKGV